MSSCLYQRAGADYEAAHDAVARQAETAVNGRAAPPASQQGLPMAPPQRPPGAAPPGMAPPGMAPPAGAYGSSRAGVGGPPAGAPPSYSSYPGKSFSLYVGLDRGYTTFEGEG